MKGRNRRETPEPGTEGSYVGVIFEEFQHKLDLVLEAIAAQRLEFKAELARLEERLTERIVVLEMAVTELSGRVGRLEERMDRMEGQMAGISRLAMIHDADIALLKQRAG